jgi:hypothetical protein
MTIEGDSNIEIMVTDVLGPSRFWGIGLARVLMQRNMCPEYDLLLPCLQVTYVDASTDYDGDGNGNHQEKVESTISTEKEGLIESFAG